MIEEDDPRALSSSIVARVRNILTALVLADDIAEFVRDAPVGWRVHRLSGNRQNVWSVTVSGNWRITLEVQDGQIARLDLEDYH